MELDRTNICDKCPKDKMTSNLLKITKLLIQKF